MLNPPHVVNEPTEPVKHKAFLQIFQHAHCLADCRGHLLVRKHPVSTSPDRYTSTPPTDRDHVASNIP